MASYLFFYPLPDQHLGFLRDNPAFFDAYLEGEKPQLKRGLIAALMGKALPQLPADWPSERCEGYSPEINHRQVKTFHYLLNGKHDLVQDVGCLFQTWFNTRHPPPVTVIDGENFAFDSVYTRQLREMLENLTPETVRHRLAEVEGTATDSDVDNLLQQGFDIIKQACNQAVADTQGLLWTNR